MDQSLYMRHLPTRERAAAYVRKLYFNVDVGEKTRMVFPKVMSTECTASIWQLAQMLEHLRDIRTS